MERGRAVWTDERLDDLSRRMNAGFDRLDADLRVLRTDLHARGETLTTKIDVQVKTLTARMDERFTRMDERFDRMDLRFDALAGQFNALNRTLLQIAIGVATAVLVATLGFLLTHI